MLDRPVNVDERVVVPAGYPVPVTDRHERLRECAAILRKWTARLEHAPARGIYQVGTRPGMYGRRRRPATERSGILARRPFAYGWSGCSKRSRVAACSTMLPAYRTHTESQIRTITPRSWVMKSID